MIVEIFAIGTELCYGRIYDTNSFWIADQLTRIGALVNRITCICDDKKIMKDALQEALQRYPSLIITTGGLGPTPDDITIEVLANVTGRKIVLNQEILREYAKRRKTSVASLPQNIISMAKTLTGAQCFSNPVGGAPATKIENGDTWIITLPGPPKEAKFLFQKHIFPLIKSRTNLISCNGRITVSMYESEISPILSRITKKTSNIYMKPIIKDFCEERGLPIEIIVFGKKQEEIKEKLVRIVKLLKEQVVKEGGTLTSDKKWLIDSS
jgi:molybdenum cofactor synthesis domain-containing protein